jgi:hypothetical protein
MDEFYCRRCGILVYCPTPRQRDEKGKLRDRCLACYFIGGIQDQAERNLVASIIDQWNQWDGEDV